MNAKGCTGALGDIGKQHESQVEVDAFKESWACCWFHDCEARKQTASCAVWAGNKTAGA